MRWLIAVAVLSLFLTSCGKKGSGSENENSPSGPGTQGFYIDSSVPAWQKDLFQHDFQYLKNLTLSKPPSNDFKSYFGVSDFSGSTLSSWLNERVKYIVGETWDWEKNVTSTTRTYAPSLAAEFFEPFADIVTLMENVGAGIYRDGKSSSKLYTVSVAGQSFEVKSTRVGIIRIGEGLFTANQVKGKDYKEAVNTLLRLGVFVHEARHSDGNGTNAAFPHAKCTTGTYTGRYSCEGNLNGPYAIEAILLVSFYDSCTNCTSEEKQALASAAVDSYSRVQSDAKLSDSRPEYIK